MALNHIAQQYLRFLDAVQNAIIPAICSVFTVHVCVAAQNVHQLHGQIQLLCRWLPSGHIQL